MADPAPTPGPHDPDSPAVAAAVQMHELFSVYRVGGFTESQALFLISQMVSAGAIAASFAAPAPPCPQCGYCEQTP